MEKSFIIQTYSGAAVEIKTSPGAKVSVDLGAMTKGDFIHCLSNINRWNGQPPVGVSVAQHLVICCHLARRLGHITTGDHLHRELLLHDFAEAITGDIVTPIKNMIDSLSNGRYKLVEAAIERAVYRLFGEEKPRALRPTKTIKGVDLLSMALEARHFLNQPNDVRLSRWVEWVNSKAASGRLATNSLEPQDIKLVEMSAPLAKRLLFAECVRAGLMGWDESVYFDRAWRFDND